MSAQIYAGLVLLATAVIAPLPYIVLAMVLLAALLFIAIRQPPPRWNIAITLVVIFLAPLALESGLKHVTALVPIATQIVATALILPVLYLLDLYLRENVLHTRAFTREKGERNTTYTFVSLLIAVLAVMLISPVVDRPVLLFTGVALALYLLCVMLWVLFSIPRQPFSADTMARRIIVGTTGRTRLNLTSRSRVKMHSQLRFTVPWVQVEPQQVILEEGSTNLELNFTPPLAGESRPQLNVSTFDPRGLVQINQLLEPLDLHIIPRAKYAEWLAMKYLEQTGSGVVSSMSVPQDYANHRRGIDYMESRTYQPGDPLRHIDWKHTFKLSQLIVREFQETGELAVIIAVNLSVADAEAADSLAFNLLTAALTLARENAPIALAAYNQRDVVLNTGITESLEILRQALSLIRKIEIVKFADRYLEPTNIAKIRRNIKQLQQTDSEPARRLLEIFNFEHHSIEEIARNHPATLAMTAATRHISAPAMILVLSQLNHDAEAVLVTAEKLAKRRFTTVPIELT